VLAVDNKTVKVVSLQFYYAKDQCTVKGYR